MADDVAESAGSRVEGDVFGVSDFPQAVTLLLTVVCFSVIVGLFLLTRRAVDPMLRTAIQQMKQKLGEEQDVHAKQLGALPTTIYEAKPDVEAQEPEICALCLEAYEPGSVLRHLPCGHSYHKTCVDAWLIERQHHTCPLCKDNPLESTSQPASPQLAPVVPEAAPEPVTVVVPV